VNACDVKLFRHSTCNSDIDLLKKDLLDIQLWMEKWLLKLKIKNAKSFHMDIILNSKNDYYLQSEGSISVLENLEYIKDLGVTLTLL